jgi:hypothetical protein
MYVIAAIAITITISWEVVIEEVRESKQGNPIDYPVIVPLKVLTVKSRYKFASVLFLSWFRATPAFLLQIVPNGLFGRKPVPTNFFPDDNFISEQASNVAGREATHLRSFRDGYEL